MRSEVNNSFTSNDNSNAIPEPQNTSSYRENYIKWLENFCQYCPHFIDNEYLSDEMCVGEANEKMLKQLPNFFNIVYAYYLKNLIPVQFYHADTILTISTEKNSYEIKRINSTTGHRYIVTQMRSATEGIDYKKFIADEPSEFLEEKKEMLNTLSEIVSSLKEKNVPLDSITEIIAKIY